MDPVSLGFYAVICGALSALAPAMRLWQVRLLVGALVGVAAASLLPLLLPMLRGSY